MNKSDGLSARQKSILTTNLLDRQTFGSFWVIIVLILLLGSCNETSKGQQSDPRIARAQDSINNPKVNVNVNRRFDDKGNLIEFDSVYSSYYSNVRGDTSQMDSIMKGFDTFFHNQHPMFFNNQMNTLFFNDSLKYPDFFHDDFFMQQYQLNDLYMRNMMMRMDSIKNQFYEDQHLKTKPNIQPKKGS